MTSSAPAICGTSFGLTKLAASMRLRPARGQPIAKLGPHGRLEYPVLVLQPVAGTDVADDQAHTR